MKRYSNVSASEARAHLKTTMAVWLVLLLLAYPLVGCATSSVHTSGGSRYPAITVYVGSG